MNKLNWTRRRADEYVVDGLPVMLRKYKVPGGASWFVRVPLEADPNYADGWAWMDAWDEKPNYPEKMGAWGRITDAMDYVREHLDQILAYAAKQHSGWPHLEGVPASLGEYISNYAADGSITYTSSEPPADPEPAPKLPEPATVPDRPRTPVLIDYNWAIRAGHVVEWDSQTGRLVLEIGHPDARALLDGQAAPGSAGVLLGVTIRTFIDQPAEEA